MRQTLHIFRKDARLSWPYIAIVAAMTAMLAILTPKWQPVYNPGFFQTNCMVDLLQLLLPLAWWLTIAHTVHRERLVGDRQFWITRPYSWKSLFAAKALFAVLFLVVPFLISDCYILWMSGFSPVSMMPALLARQCSLALILLLPPFLLAALTRGIRQFLLGVLGLIVAFATVAWVQQFHPAQASVGALANLSSPRATVIAEWGLTILYAGGTLALILWQYAGRRTTAVRAVVLAAIAWTMIQSGLPPKVLAYSSNTPVQFPEISVAYAPQRGPLGQDGVAGFQDKVQIDIPIELTGRAPGMLTCELAQIRLTQQGREVWRSGWSWWIHTSDRGGKDWLELMVDRHLFPTLSRGPMDLDAVFAVTLYERQETVHLRATGEWTSVPGVGLAAIPTKPEGYNVIAHIPLSEPSQRLCAAIHGADPAESSSTASWGGSYPPAAGFHITPVITLLLMDNVSRGRFSPWYSGELTVDRPIALIRRDLKIPAIQLRDYVVTDSR